MNHQGIAVAAILDMYRRMLRIRRFEEEVGRLFRRGQLPGFVHLYIGEEAIAAGVCAVLTDADTIISTHRGHGHVIAKGGDMRRMMAELFGKATGYCKGKGGSMHIADFDIGMLGACGIVGGGLPVAVGAGLSAWYENSDRVSVCFFGDGAANEGSFHESLNLASVLRLPVLFVCENNHYGEFTPATAAMNIEDIAARAAGYGKVPGNPCFFFSCDDMTPQVNNPGWVRALEEYVAIREVGDPEMINYDVADTRTLYATGSSVLNLDWGDVGTISVDENVSIIKGDVGFGVLPGGDSYWDYEAGEWVMTENPAPFIAFGGWIISVAADC